MNKFGDRKVAKPNSFQEIVTGIPSNFVPSILDGECVCGCIDADIHDRTVRWTDLARSTEYSLRTQKFWQDRMSSKIIFLCLKTYARSCTFSNQVFRPEKRKLRADTVYIFLNFDLNREYIGIWCLPNLCTPLSTTCMLTTEKKCAFLLQICRISKTHGSLCPRNSPRAGRWGQSAKKPFRRVGIDDKEKVPRRAGNHAPLELRCLLLLPKLLKTAFSLMIGC